MKKKKREEKKKKEREKKKKKEIHVINKYIGSTHIRCISVAIITNK